MSTDSPTPAEVIKKNSHPIITSSPTLPCANPLPFTITATARDRRSLIETATAVSKNPRKRSEHEHLFSTSIPVWPKFRFVSSTLFKSFNGSWQFSDIGRVLLLWCGILDSAWLERATDLTGRAWRIRSDGGGEEARAIASLRGALPQDVKHAPSNRTSVPVAAVKTE